MKFSKLSQLFLVSSIGLLVATLLTACLLVTIDYCFRGQLDGLGLEQRRRSRHFAVDSGRAPSHRRHPQFLGRRPPVAMAVTPDYAISTWPIGQQHRGALHHRHSGALTQRTDHPAAPRCPRREHRRELPLRGYRNHLRHAARVFRSLPAPLARVHGPRPRSFPAILRGDTVVPTGVTVLANDNAVYVSAYDRRPTTRAAPPHQRLAPRLGFRVRHRLRRRPDAGPRQPLSGRRVSPAGWSPIPPTAFSM